MHLPVRALAILDKRLFQQGKKFSVLYMYEVYIKDNTLPVSLFLAFLMILFSKLDGRQQDTQFATLAGELIFP